MKDKAIIYPFNWQRVPKICSFFLRIQNHSRAMETKFSSIELDGCWRDVDASVISKNISRNCTILKLTVEVPASEGKFVLSIFDKLLGTLIDQTGFIVSSDGVSCASSANEIEDFITALSSARFNANGMGKSGTTWLYRMLGALPGCHCVDMTENGLRGIDHTELSKVPLNGVFHGHLRCGAEVIKNLVENNFYHFHITRDFRDVIVSEYFHKFSMEKGKGYEHLRGLSKEELLSFDNISKWSTTFYSVFEEMNWKRQNNIALIKYEELTSDPEYVMGKAFSKLGLPNISSIIEFIVRINSFKYVTKGRAPGETENASPVRNGVPGNWKEHLSQETEEKIITYFRPVFEDLGYI